MRKFLFLLIAGLFLIGTALLTAGGTASASPGKSVVTVSQQSHHHGCDNGWCDNGWDNGWCDNGWDNGWWDNGWGNCWDNGWDNGW